ncbi:bifunctional UDP-N-acetylglucosamine diphosphorylase/glucosamine-1-phosphate N-acetyltransferase GlmU [Arenicella xantha]|uniref:Bifunctional protein GlmU n=1 Tax=Arenicella xantha TaxID=644221 RepID=A0A395JST4_9GAMM|nr:bifunctional UDP-N-acetylglucosamine diphosphorylase/glucosamine-1-phosphate N-acetyltransferase GlmU [Arenicella xantha]RBP53605.1 UDP-N-acetylglucosamine pyrophosphorylase /glucosamine-1-phosphate N-acetyltransferase [Arenicella xantha]
MSNRPLHIVILAAGKGSRMLSDQPKILHQVAGKSLLDHVLDSALGLNPQMIHIVVGHGKDEVMAAFEHHTSRSLFSWVEQTEQLGTGHAVSTALPAIPEEADVLTLTADVPLIKQQTLSDLTACLDTHCLAILTATVADPTGLGRITRNDDGDITGIVEHKDANSTQRAIREINSGIICARRSELADWLTRIDSDNAQNEYYLTDILGLAHQDGAPIASRQPAQNHEVMGINSRKQLAEVERLYQRELADLLMEQGVTLRDPSRIDIRGDVTIGADTIIDVNVVIEGPTHIGRHVTIAPNCIITASRIADSVKIHANTVIEQTEISSGANVGPFARLRPGTTIGENARIGNFVETKNSKLAEGAKVNHLSYVGDATVGRNTNIGAGVITCNYDGANKHQTTIGNDVFVGSDCQLVAPVEIEDGATIGAGSTITQHVGKNQLAISRGRQRQISGWQRPVKKKLR